MNHYVFISDTHLPKRDKGLPQAFQEAVKGATAIFHTGDYVDLAVLLELECYAPLYGVHGNNDPWEVMDRVPASRIVELEGLRIGMVHGHIGRARTTPERAREAFSPGEVDIIFFGHSHQPFDDIIGGIRCINPGSLCEPRREPNPSFITFQIHKTTSIPKLDTKLIIVQ